jgi:D-3-phosphoglycerate dehydrogenase
MYKVVVTTEFADEQLISIAKDMLKGKADVVFDPVYSKEENIIAKCKDADAVIACYDPFTDKVFKALPKLKLVSVISIGFNFIDAEAAKKYGISVSNNPTYCVEEVANHTLALVMALNRKLFDYNKAVKADNIWNAGSQKGQIKRLNKQTFGLVGFGNIARRVAKRMQATGAKVIAYDPFIKQDFADQFACKW